jgi:uroporphyrinogen-III synthase
VVQQGCDPSQTPSPVDHDPSAGSVTSGAEDEVQHPVDDGLTGRRIIVTRAATRKDSLAAKLEAIGAEVIPLPLIETAPPADGGVALRSAVDRLVAGDYTWVVVGSPTAAEVLIDALDGRWSATAAPTKVCAVGPGTADVLGRAGIAVELVPDRHVGEGVIEAFARLGSDAQSGRVLVPRAAVARDVIPVGLAELGWEVEVVEAYRTVAVDPSPSALSGLARSDAVTLTSSSTADRFADLVDSGVPQPPIVVCIGPVTAETARGRGLTGIVVAGSSTLDDLVDAALAALSRPADS